MKENENLERDLKELKQYTEVRNENINEDEIISPRSINSPNESINYHLLNHTQDSCFIQCGMNNSQTEELFEVRNTKQWIPINKANLKTFLGFKYKKSHKEDLSGLQCSKTIQRNSVNPCILNVSSRVVPTKRQKLQKS